MARPRPDSTTRARRRFLRRRLFGHSLAWWKAWSIRAACVLPLVLVVGWIVLTHSPLTSRLVLPSLARMLGVDLDARRVVITLDGRVIMEGVEARVPGLTGPAATFLTVDRLTARMDWSTTVRNASPSVRRIVVAGPVVRLSQSTENDRLNVASLRLVSSTGGALDLPTIIAQNAVVEIGEHSAANYTTLRRLFLAGELIPAPDATQAYDVNLREAGPALTSPGARGGLRLAGRIDDHGAELNLTGVRLDALDPKSVPTPVRDIFRDLDLRGDITQARLNYSRQRGVVATILLDGVDITPPIPPEQIEPGVGRPMRLHDTTGSVTFSPTGLRASLAGQVEDLPYKIELDYRGLTPDAAFTATIVTQGFDVQENPDLLPYAPRMVRKRFANFSNPTARVDATVIVGRDEPTPDGPAPVRVEGRLEFIDGRAAFEKFPYAFQDLTARVHFTDTKIVIEEVTGSAPSGARLTASGLIEPLTGDAYFDLDVHVTGVPVDQTLLDAMGPVRAKLVETIMSESELRRLVGEGLVAAEPGADAPYFQTGGTGTIDVNVVRELGEESIWHVNVDVRFDELGILVDRFPYPIVGRDVAIRIVDEDIELVGGEFTGLDGGRADISATITSVGRGPDRVYVPRVHVEADAVPLGPLLAGAVPDASPDGAQASPRRILRALGMRGLARASVDVGPREGTELGYDAVARVVGAASDPAPDAGDEAMRLRDITARITSSESGMSLVAEADAECPALGEVGSVTVSVDAAFGEHTTSRLQADGLDTAAAVDHYVSIFSDKAAAELRTVRETMRPTGAIDVDLLAVSRPGKDTDITVALDDPRDLAFDLFGGRVGIRDAEGQAVIDVEAVPRIRFDDARALVDFDDAPAGRVAIGGRVPLAALARREAPEGADDLGALTLHATDARLESGLAAYIVDTYLPGRAAAFFHESNPRGSFDADTTLEVVVGEDGRFTYEPTGVLRPRVATIDRRGLDLTLRTDASITFARRWGTIDHAHVETDAWTADATGSWNAGAQAIDFETTFDLVAERDSDGLRAMIPKTLVDILDTVSVGVDGPLHVRNARLTGSRAPTDAGSALEFHADIDFENASVEPGVPVTEASGSVAVGFERAPLDGPPAYELAFSLDRLRAAGLRMTDARALLLSADRDRELLLPLFTARSHAGRVSASAHVWPTSADPASPLEYASEFRLSGVRFGPLLADVMPDQRALQPNPTEVWAEPSDRSRGDADAGIALAGVVGDHDSRRGSGVIEILGGSVLRLPGLIVQLIELSNLQPPASERLDYARAAFFIDGDFIGFEDLSVFSRSISILGSGSMTWEDKDVDLRFHTRAARRIPMLSQIIEGIRDELATATVKGPLGQHAIRVEQFAGDSSLIENLFRSRRSRVSREEREPETVPINPSRTAGENGDGDE